MCVHLKKTWWLEHRKRRTRPGIVLVEKVQTLLVAFIIHCCDTKQNLAGTFLLGMALQCPQLLAWQLCVDPEPKYSVFLLFHFLPSSSAPALVKLSKNFRFCTLLSLTQIKDHTVVYSFIHQLLILSACEILRWGREWCIHSFIHAINIY